MVSKEELENLDPNFLIDLEKQLREEIYLEEKLKFDEKFQKHNDLIASQNRYIDDLEEKIEENNFYKLERNAISSLIFLSFSLSLFFLFAIMPLIQKH